MITAVDSSILLDILLDDPSYAASSEHALRRALLEGKCIICECVLAEVFPALSTVEKVREFLQDLHLDYIPCSLECSLEAGSIFTGYLKRKGKSKGIIADFLIAAHAHHHAERLLTRDRGFYREYFPDLVLFSG